MVSDTVATSKVARNVRRAVSRALPCALDEYRRAALYLTHHGAVTCTAVDPHCGVCPLLRTCPAGQEMTSSVRL